MAALVHQIIRFCSDQFTLLLLLGGSFLLLFLTILIFVRLSDFEIRKRLNVYIQNFLFFVVLTGQIIFIVMLVQRHENVAASRTSENDAHLQRKQDFVKQDLDVFFIDGNALKSINIKTRQETHIFYSDQAVREYHFSQDGTKLAVVTENRLHVVDLSTLDHKQIESALDGQMTGSSIKGSINHFRWAPDGRKLCYEINRWTEFSSKSDLVFYDVESGLKKSIPSPLKKLSALYWDETGKNIYYGIFTSNRLLQAYRPFDIQIYRIDTDTLSSQYVLTLAYQDTTFPVDELAAEHDIKLYTHGEQLSFGSGKTSRNDTDKMDGRLGVDDGDLYVTSRDLIKRALLDDSQENAAPNNLLFKEAKGESVLGDILWLPQKQYALLADKQRGLVIIEPRMSNVALLADVRAEGVGWYRQDE